MRREGRAEESQWCRGSTRVSGTLDPGSTPGWDAFLSNFVPLLFIQEAIGSFLVFIHIAYIFCIYDNKREWPNTSIEDGIGRMPLAQNNQYWLFIKIE